MPLPPLRTLPRALLQWPSAPVVSISILALCLGACGADGTEATSPTSSLPGSSGGAEEPPRPDGDPAARSTASAWPEEAASRGLDHVNRSGEPAKATILEANGAGVATIDLEGDGDLDLVFAQGLGSLKEAVAGPGADLEVFLNDGDGRFERAPGPGLSGWWTGLAAGDVNGDGRADLVAGGYGALRVLLQDEAGRLVPGAELVPAARALVPGAPREAGAAPAWTTSLALFDADGDGRLDLYAGQYLDLDPLDPVVGEISDGPLSLPCRWKGHVVYCGPRGLEPQPDRVFRGLGDGRFEEQSAAWLPDHEAGYTLAVLPSDVDGDGDTDLFVANDSSANLLLVNDGAGLFRDHGFEAGVAFSADGNPEAGMGIAAGDVNRDGLFDYAVTNFSDEPTALYYGSPMGFTNETFKMGLGAQTRALLSWSVHIEDFDGDTWLELFTANGHVYPQADEELTGTSYAQLDALWQLGPQARARRREARGTGSVLSLERGTRGTAIGDLDGDGAPDLVLCYIDGPCGLGMNRSGPGARRLVLCLSAPPPADPTPGQRVTPRDAMGARVVLVLGEGAQAFALMKEVQTSQGYQSASSPWLSFGLGQHAAYQSLEVRWPSGAVTRLPGGPAGRRLQVDEAAGLVSSEELR